MCSSTAPEVVAGQQQPTAISQSQLDQLQACQYSSWHALYRSHALRSCIIPLPAAFVEYLLSDGVYLGVANSAIPKYHTASDYSDDDQQQTEPEQTSNASSEHGEDSSSEEENEGQDWTQTFPELHERINAAIQTLGGQVVPKLNWSCPSDAVWINPGSTLACNNAEQVVLMLKSSDRVVHDLDIITGAEHPLPIIPSQGQTQPQNTETTTYQTESATDAHGTNSTTTDNAQSEVAVTSGQQQQTTLQATLVLRKWYDLRPEREWRCFVRNRQLVAVCQRDHSQHFPQLTNATQCNLTDEDGDQQDRHVDQQAHPAEVAAGMLARQACWLLHGFHQQHIKDTFSIANYAFDAYVATNNSIRLIDINPIGGTTSPLLFTWEELGFTEDSSGELNPQEGAVSTSVPSVLNSSISQSIRDTEDEEQGLPVGVCLRVVPSAAFVNPGQRAACSMPFDMLGLQDSMADIITKMQQQQQDE